MEELDIKDILEKLEDGYDIIKSNLIDEQTDFLKMGDAVLEENALPSIDLPLTLNDYLMLLKE